MSLLSDVPDIAGVQCWWSPAKSPRTIWRSPIKASNFSTTEALWPRKFVDVLLAFVQIHYIIHLKVCAHLRLIKNVLFYDCQLAPFKNVGGSVERQQQMTSRHHTSMAFIIGDTDDRLRDPECEFRALVETQPILLLNLLNHHPKCLTLAYFECYFITSDQLKEHQTSLPTPTLFPPPTSINSSIEHHQQGSVIDRQLEALPCYPATAWATYSKRIPYPERTRLDHWRYFRL